MIGGIVYKLPQNVVIDGQWEWIDDRKVKRYRNSKRVPGIWPEIWARANETQREELRQDFISKWGELPPPYGGGFTPAAASLTAPIADVSRTIIEFCCGHDSLIGKKENKTNKKL